MIATCNGVARADVTLVTEFAIDDGYDRRHETRPPSETTDRHGGAWRAARNTRWELL
jgi:hypothetical protein